MKELLEFLEQEKLVDALVMIDGMPHAIDSFIKEEMTSRPLSDLKATFL